MVMAEGLVRDHPRTWALAELAPEERPAAVQIAGGEPAVLGRAAERLAERGADLIDINMGCPVRKVVERCAGAAMLKDPERAAEAVAEVKRRSGLPVTVKMRTGWNDTRESIAAARALEQAGAAALAVHGRTREQQYGGRSDLAAIREVKRAVGIPVIGNGDVRTREDAVRMLETTGCDAVMIGRAAFGDPWVFRRMRAYHERGETLPPPTAAERLAAGLRHLRLMVAEFGEVVASREMRKHLAWYIKGLPHSARVREQVNHTPSTEALAALLRGYLDELERAGLSGIAPEPAATPAEAVGATG
jgi:nifR3 family TIM-barrel protein